MRKGFGLYSPHETTVFFLKTLLISFWLGLDLIAALLIATLPVAAHLEYRSTILAVVAALSAGTGFALLFAWATGSLFGRVTRCSRHDIISLALYSVKRRPYYLLAVGTTGVAMLVIFVVRSFSQLQYETGAFRQLARADIAIGKKCAEVAGLERRLFQSDEEFVMAQCLIQYDTKYAALREGASRQR